MRRDDTAELALTDPAEYERLLHGYFLLLGERRLWWQRCAEADDPSWKACVAAAITQLARRSKCPPAWLADVLDDPANTLPATRRRILRMSRESFYERRQAA